METGSGRLEPAVGVYSGETLAICNRVLADAGMPSAATMPNANGINRRKDSGTNICDLLKNSCMEEPFP